MKWDWQPILLS